MKEFRFEVVFENGLADILEIKETSLENAKNKILSQNAKRLKSPLFRDKTSKIISISEFK